MSELVDPGAPRELGHRVEAAPPRLMHAWYSPKQDAICGTATHRLLVVGDLVETTEISEEGGPRGWDDARWLGIVEEVPVAISDKRMRVTKAWFR